ncbi:MAG: hypothetical protein LBK82_09945 [Planctomycetaceae bacterium]|nr:hypothetical protein [Planctomycetaceae bacterium]
MGNLSLKGCVGWSLLTPKWKATPFAVVYLIPSRRLPLSAFGMDFLMFGHLIRWNQELVVFHSFL